MLCEISRGEVTSPLCCKILSQHTVMDQMFEHNEQHRQQPAYRIKDESHIEYYWPNYFWIGAKHV